MSSRLLKKALAASNQLSEGYSPWAKYKLKNPSSSSAHQDDRRKEDLEEKEEENNDQVVVLDDDSADAGVSAGGIGRGAGRPDERRASAGAPGQAAAVVSEQPLHGTSYHNPDEDSTVLDDDDLDVTIPLSDTFPGLAAATTPRRAAAAPPTDRPDDDHDDLFGEGTPRRLSGRGLLGLLGIW